MADAKSKAANLRPNDARPTKRYVVALVSLRRTVAVAALASLGSSCCSNSHTIAKRTATNAPVSHDTLRLQTSSSVASLNPLLSEDTPELSTFVYDTLVVSDAANHL